MRIRSDSQCRFQDIADFIGEYFQYSQEDNYIFKFFAEADQQSHEFSLEDTLEGSEIADGAQIFVYLDHTQRRAYQLLSNKSKNSNNIHHN